MEQVTRLVNGDRFPALSTPIVGGASAELPDAAAPWQVILFYRGHWCTFCRGQLDDFNAHYDALRALDVAVIAISTDTAEEAAATVSGQQLRFPLGYGIDGPAVARRIGAYFEPIKGYLHATGFILEHGRVLHATYSSGPLGRLEAHHVVRLVKHLNQRRAAVPAL